MNATGTTNYQWSRHFVAGLAGAGLAHVVISPGARSTPLALAFLRRPEVRCHVLVDERSAGFFALGLAKATELPVALLCTSGSAPAHWLPAVIEADAGRVPLLLLSADRPPEVHGWGANQTVNQLRLFAGFVRGTHALGTPEEDFVPRQVHTLAARVLAESRWPCPGPVHVNLPFREPLLPPVAKLASNPAGTDPSPIPCLEAAPPLVLPAPHAVAQAAARLSGRPGLILAGGLVPGEGGSAYARAVTALARALACPVLVEPLSGLRHGSAEDSHLLAHGEALVRDGSFTAAHPPAWILRFGAAPVSRALQTWLGQCIDAGSELLLVESHGGWPDPERGARMLLRGEATATAEALAAAATAPAPRPWLADWQAAERQARQRAAACLAQSGDALWEAPVVADLVAALAPESRLFWGNSMAVRDGDAFSGLGDKPLECHGNRGASGIDGQLSTALGLAAAGTAEGRQTAALLGDLAAHHDLNALAAARGLDCLLVVINNGGGGIFEYLPPRSLPEYERGWLTPVPLALAHGAAAYAVPYRRATTRAVFQAAIAEALAQGGPWLIEAVVERADSVARHRAYWAEFTTDNAPA
ncbi:MAG TPA: 2-succinyl-5-enolpyruvyl-6-hydroxy-3-cyclohexene-1-carboxylic-acid synthase [Azospira sp.]|nr:2-succinyl-5-enolpyruvyl-6-hydroxy-3-cyclohexene-1-carboxylic-acid synthase [Azospira sp.]